MERLRPSLEEAFVISTQEEALDWIGKRGTNDQAAVRAERIRYARDILRLKLLPHVGVTSAARTSKVFFLGYMVNRLLCCAMGRAETTDRDHYANKRLDLAGPLLASLFRMNFQQLCKATYKSLQKSVNAGRPINVAQAIKSEIITRGMSYSLGTGNMTVPCLERKERKEKKKKEKKRKIIH